MSDAKSKIKNATYPILLGMVVLSSAVIYTDLETVVDTISLVEIETILIVASLVFLAYILRFLKWHYFLYECGEPTPLRTSLYVFFSGLAMVITPAKGGELWKAWLLQSRTGTKKSKTGVVVFAERLTDLVALLLLGISVIYTIANVWFLISVVILTIISILMREYIISFVTGIISNRLSEDVDESRQNILDTANDLVSFKSLLISIVLSVLSWLLEGIGLWYILIEAGGGIDALTTVSIFSASSVAGALSFLPGGLAVTEGSMVSLLVIQSVPKALATQSTILIRTLTLWFAAFLGLFVYTIGRIRE